MTHVKIGTRGSQLALWQANWVKDELLLKNPSISIEIVIIKTKGDRIVDRPLAMVGGKGLFVTEIEDALLDGRIDIAVHSMKDMPGIIPDGLSIGAVPERETPGDVLISRNGLKISELPQGARVGTSSLRRSSQLLHLRPDIEIIPLRGNLNTRLKKLTTENLDGIILAAAGVKRLGLADRITEFIDEEIMLPAVAQGALCIEIRTEDPTLKPLVEKLNHHDTNTAVAGERAFLRCLEGNCKVPVAAWGTIVDNLLTLRGLVADVNGNKIFFDKISGPEETSIQMGEELGKSLLSKGAGEILEKLKTNAKKW